MNEHIKPIFELVIPRIQSANIKYWIYGGLGYASMAGQCYRDNTDVDLFVMGNDFEIVKKILENMCEENSWKLCQTFVNNRLKLEVFFLKNKKKWIERLSVVPAYQKNSQIELKFRKGSGKYSPDILLQVERHVENFTFSTINNQFLKKLFLEYLDSKRKYPTKRVEDARYVLSEEEFKKYFPNETYNQNV